MALGMDRSLFGDLVLQQDRAYLFALPEVAVRLPEEWQEAGRTPIKISLPEEPPVIVPPSGVLLRDTVPSLRLDCVLASGMKISRARAAELIRQGLVQVDHRPELGTDTRLEAGCTLSVRHFGRIRLKEIGSLTRKDRLPVVLEIFAKSS